MLAHPAHAPHSQMYFSGEYQQDSYHNTPLFERMGRNDLAELRECHQTMHELEGRCQDLERINNDLERRLETQAREKMAVDREITQMNRAWEERLKGVEEDRNSWKLKADKEGEMCEIVREKLRRTEKELHRILQKKYDIVQAAKREERTSIMEKEQIARDIRMQQAASGSTLNGNSGRSSTNLSRQVTSNPQGGGAVAIREKRVVDSLCDFFGL